MKKAIILMTVICTSFNFYGCGKEERYEDTVTLVTREEGSGTREAFSEILNITDKYGADAISDSAEVTNSTSVMLQSIADDVNAIGYVSLGSLPKTVKALSVDGVKITETNIKNGRYKIFRKFLICRRPDIPNRLEDDLVSFILSNEGQKIVSEKGFVSFDGRGHYSPAFLKGKITMAGSTSVSPVAEALYEEYEKLNPGTEFEIQQTGSAAGISAAIDGISDWGLSSRPLKGDEKDKLTETEIALDGIAVIVNKKNRIDNLSAKTIKNLFEGKITRWSEIK